LNVAPLKTYSHLAAARRMPTEYEIVSSKLLYYVGKGFEVEIPLADWYARYQAGSPLTIADWERFADPRATTYTQYVTIQKDQEAYVDGVLRSVDDGGYDRALDGDWIRTLDALVSPLRFVGHGLQMVAAYVGQMAPSGRITIVSAFQAADEMRRVQRIAYRTAQVGLARGAVGDGAREAWQRGEAWQPLRRVVEKLLVAYDWGEAFTALNLCVKPLVDQLFMVDVAETARARGDSIFAAIAFSLDEDCRWHRQWAEVLARLAVEMRPANADVLRSWVRFWLPQAEEAIAALATLQGPSIDSKVGAIARVRQWLLSMDLL
jgi:toluene monooxygenase system protein E